MDQPHWAPREVQEEATDVSSNQELSPHPGIPPNPPQTTGVQLQGSLKLWPAGQIHSAAFSYQRPKHCFYT